MQRPQGFHCSRFDTALLREIIATDVDTAVRMLRRERGVIVDAATQHAWTESVTAEVEASLLTVRDMHALLPSVIDERIARAIRRLTDGDVSFLPQAALPARSWRLCRFWPVHKVLLAFRPRNLEKQLE